MLNLVVIKQVDNFCVYLTLSRHNFILFEMENLWIWPQISETVMFTLTHPDIIFKSYYFHKALVLTQSSLSYWYKARMEQGNTLFV